jgi:cyclase
MIGQSLVKTVRFGKYGYIGDPVNTVKIFNELEVDELCFLDIRATVEKREPDFRILAQIADECFMPLSYGGGIRDEETAAKIFSIGFEKIVLNSAAFDDPGLVTRIASHSGSQSVIGSIDAKRNIFGKYHVFRNDGTMDTGRSPAEWAKELESAGAGEILVTSMDNDGTWKGYDTALIRSVSESVSIPVIANGGAGSIGDIGQALKKGLASAVALGSMIVYQKKGMGVLINMPDRVKLNQVINPTGIL